MALDLGMTDITMTEQTPSEASMMPTSNATPQGTRNVDKLVVRQLLKLSRDVATLQAATLTSYMSHADQLAPPLMDDLDTFTKQFALTMKNKTAEERQKAGSLHLRMIQKVVQACLAQAEAQNVEVWKAQILAWAADFRERGEQAIASDWPVFKIQRAYKPRHKRIVCAIKPSTPSARLWEVALEPWLLKSGARKLQGVAPKGDLERRLQEWIDLADPRRSSQD